MKNILLITLLLLAGCGSALTPEVMSVTRDMLELAAKAAKDNGQLIPDFPKDCITEYYPGIDHDRLLALCEWHIPREK